MNSQSQGYVQEIEFQTKMLTNLKKWLKLILLISSLGVLLIYGFASNTPLKIFGIVLLVVSIVLAFVIGLAIYNGQKNVNKVIDELELVKNNNRKNSKGSLWSFAFKRKRRVYDISVDFFRYGWDIIE